MIYGSNENSYDVYVVFGGLVAWVPRTAEVKYPENAKVPGASRVEIGSTVILPRVDEAHPYACADGSKVCSHDARLALILGRGDLPDGEAPPHVDGQVLKRLRQLGKEVGELDIEPRSWKLVRETVSFEIPESSGAPPFTRLRGLCGFEDRYPEDRSNLADDEWTPSMNEICRGHQALQDADKVHPTCLAGTSDTHPRVNTLVELRHGYLLTMSLLEVEGQTIPHVFRSLDSKVTATPRFDRAITDSVVLRIPIHDPEDKGLRIVRTPFGGAPSNLTIEPVTLFGRRLIILSLGNWPHRHHAEDWRAPAGHFEVMYDLSAVQVPREYRFVPQARGREGMRSFGNVVPGSGLESRRMARSTWWRRWLHLSSEVRQEQKLIDRRSELAGYLYTATKKDPPTPICGDTRFQPEDISVA